MENITKTEIAEIESYALRNNGMVRRYYSGRGMLGTPCIGVILEFIPKRVPKRLGRWKIDDMGRDYIIYFPDKKDPTPVQFHVLKEWL